MPRSWILRLFAEDLGTRVLALAVATVLWALVSVLGARTTVVDDVPVNLVGLRDDLALAAPLDAVDVKIRAPRLLLQQRNVKDLLRAFVDVSGRGVGTQSGEVTVSPADPQVDVVIILPARVMMTLDPVVQRSFPITVISEGSPAEGYSVGEATIEPKTVQARGALGRLQHVTGIPVSIPIQGATAAIEGEYPLRPPEGISLLTDRARVNLDIVQTEETKTLGVRVVTRGRPAAGYWVRAISADPPVVTVRGSRAALGARTFLETVAVDIDEGRSPIEREVDLVLSPEVSVSGSAPRVRVRAEVVPLENTKDVTASVQVERVPDGLRVSSVSPASVRVTVRGDEGVLPQLSADDIRVVLTASGQSSGTFALRPTLDMVRLPEGVRAVSLEEGEVRVTLE